MKKWLRFFGVMVFILLSASMMHAQYKYLVIPSCNFRPNDEAIQFWSSYGWSYLDATSGAGTLLAPINLPQDATIISVTMSYYDSDASNEVRFRIRRVNYYTWYSQVLFSGNSSGIGGPGTALDSTLDGGSRVIKNNSFFYTAEVWPDTPAGSALAVYCVKIKYTD